MSPIPEGLGDSPTVNHKDCVKGHNHSGNLEWVTHVENIELAWENGLNNHHFGERHANCQHTDEIVHAVCRGLQAGRTARSIAEELGLRVPFVHGIKRRETRVAVSSGYTW